jgi:hypothetical protein
MQFNGKVRTEHHIKTFEIIQSCLTEFEIVIVISENIVFILEGISNENTKKKRKLFLFQVNLIQNQL